MKTGKTLTELAAEIERQASSKQDLVANTKSIFLDTKVVATGTKQVNGKPEKVEQREVFAKLGAKHEYGINGLAHDQIGLHTGVPAKYYDRMLAESPQLLAYNVNHWFSQNPAPRLIRTLDGKVRAFLSDQYRPLENHDLAEAVLPILLDMKLDIMSCEITERRLYIKAVDQRLKQDVPSGRKMGDGSHCFFDTCSPAIILSNSEVGFGQLSVDSGIYTKVCTNMAMIADGGMKRRHVGTRNALSDGEAVRHLLTDQTKRATDKAIWMQVRDVVRGAFDETRFKANTDKLAGLAKDKIETDDVVKVVELSAKQFGFTEGEGKSVLKHLISGGDLTRYGLFNAVTRTAQDLDSYDRATEFEALGGKIIELPKNDWARLAKAA